MKKSSLFLGIGAVAIIVLIAWHAWRFFAPGFVALTLIDGTTQQPLVGVKVHIFQDKWLPFPIRQLLVDYTRTSQYDAVTNAEGVIRMNVKQRNTVHVQAFFSAAEQSSTYEYVYQYIDVKQPLTISVSRKGTTQEYFATLSEIRCTGNGFFWDKYGEKCYAEPIDRLSQVNTSCSVDSDCKKICPAGCFNRAQADEPWLQDLYPGSSYCTQVEYVCSCIGGSCRGSMYPPGYTKP
ncbi:MAG: hypothetical protein WCT08_03815 [Patescibacteria group bacterium]|jgi:hypothetical protein